MGKLCSDFTNSSPRLKLQRFSQNSPVIRFSKLSWTCLLLLCHQISSLFFALQILWSSSSSVLDLFSCGRATFLHATPVRQQPGPILMVVLRKTSGVSSSPGFCLPHPYHLGSSDRAGSGSLAFCTTAPRCGYFSSRSIRPSPIRLALHLLPGQSTFLPIVDSSPVCWE